MIKLTIYDKGKAAKTLTADSYDLTLGVIEDFVTVIDVDKLDDRIELAKMVVKLFPQLKPIIRGVFPDQELTDDDFKKIRLSDMINLVSQIGFAIGESMAALGVQSPR